jgi:flagellar protein FliO/FliZ
MKTAQTHYRIYLFSLAATRLFTVGLSSASLTAWAEATPVTITPSMVMPATPSLAMAQVFFGLLLVVGTILALAWLSRRLGGALPGNGKIMKILAVLPLGTREKIVLVDVGGQQLILGVTPGQINTLQVFTQPIVPAVQTVATKSIVQIPGKNLAARSAGEFSKKLQEFLNQGNKS